MVKKGLVVIITYSDGSSEIRTGGSRAWRNNNPGNLEYRDFAKQHGAIGTDGRFAIFPDRATGETAQETLLRSRYMNKTIDEAVAAYAPPSDNDTATYQRSVSRALRLPGTTEMKTLTEEQFKVFISVLRRKEGWEEGNITYTPANKP